ncbi:hypothetical protein O3M35_005162 [Rhynocoris fuscipes]|uniref:C2H2-type domain-containing protein n=1 Tax=Rhynocoris fuscipes TaxID=488301 RepID=A0AAW1DJK6_9HEMI
MCSQTFTNRATLLRHYAAKHQEPLFNFKCDKCSIFFKTKWSLSTHKSKYHRD